MDQIKIIVLTGVSGTGKTTIGKLLADQLDWPFYDGDDFQPPANLAKMTQGIPLDDRDREPWLQSLSHLLEGISAEGGHAVLACSLLKRAYREAVLSHRPGIRLVYLKGSPDLIASRLRTRLNHFFKVDLLASQFQTLEEPDASEQAFTVVVDASPETIGARIRELLAT